MNESFYRWWFHSIYVPFLLKLRKRYELNDDIPSYFTLDGEDVQIKPMQSAEVQLACNELNIVIGKPPASTTSITQPCDAGKCYLASKTRKKHLKTVQEILDVVMTNRIKKITKSHEAKVGKTLLAHHVKAFMKEYKLSNTLFLQP